jgi:hypothetical protein
MPCNDSVLLLAKTLSTAMEVNRILWSSEKCVHGASHPSIRKMVTCTTANRIIIATTVDASSFSAATFRKNKATFHAPPARGASAPCRPPAGASQQLASASPAPRLFHRPPRPRRAPRLAPAPPWSALGSPRHGAHPPTGPRRLGGTIWNLATHAADPNFLLASSVNGQVFCSTDAGDSWSKVPREFGEVHALAWVPN